MASSHETVGSGDRHVMALHGWFGPARGWGSMFETPVALATAMEEFLGRE
jgi:hypothetical protein